jgi:hypothetical protein
MKSKFINFMFHDDGAVTVDWVVLTAAIVGLGAAVILTVSGGAISYAEFVNEDVSDIAMEVGATGEYE